MPFKRPSSLSHLLITPIPPCKTQVERKKSSGRVLTSLKNLKLLEEKEEKKQLILREKEEKRKQKKLDHAVARKLREQRKLDCAAVKLAEKQKSHMGGAQTKNKKLSRNH